MSLVEYYIELASVPITTDPATALEKLEKCGFDAVWVNKHLSVITVYMKDWPTDERWIVRAIEETLFCQVHRSEDAN